MIKDMYMLINDIPHLSQNELIRLKWAAEGLILAIRKERERRDAKAIDQILGETSETKATNL